MEREGLKLHSILPCDMTEEQLAEQRKAKARARMKRYRQSKKTPEQQTRAEYLATHSISRTKPWIAEGMKERTWWRRRKKLEAQAKEPRNHLAEVPCA